MKKKSKNPIYMVVLEPKI